MNRIDKQAQGASNRDWGALAENIAAEYLISHGYTIRERNKHIGHIELDIIAEKGDVMAFVEVKARTGEYGDPLDAVDKDKQLRMARGADVYLRAQPLFYWYRFDIITITGTPDSYQLEHYPDAFLAPFHNRVRKTSTSVAKRRK